MAVVAAKESLLLTLVVLDFLEKSYYMLDRRQKKVKLRVGYNSTRELQVLLKHHTHTGMLKV